jgi:importin-4
MIKMLEIVLKIVFHLLIEEEEEDLVDEDEETPHKIASSVLDTVAVSIPSKYVFRPVVEHSINHLIKSMNPNERKAGIVAIGVIAEGCLDSMKQNISLLIPILLNALKDQNQKVREVSFLAIHSFIEYVQPESKSKCLTF